MGMARDSSSDMRMVASQFVVPPDEVIFGCAPSMLAVRYQLEKICSTNLPVLIQGDGGSGKETLARWVHLHSPWSSGPFIKVNFAAVPGRMQRKSLAG